MTIIQSSACAVMQDGQLDHNIGRMRYMTMDLLIKLSRSFQQKRLATVFLVINLNHVSQARRQCHIYFPPNPGNRNHLYLGATDAFAKRLVSEVIAVVVLCIRAIEYGDSPSQLRA